jgi:hypothetical protein
MARAKEEAVPPVTFRPEDFPSTEELIVSPDCGGLRTPTNVQIAIARAMDGVPLGDLWKDKLVKKAFGGKKPPDKQPRTFVVLAGTRGYKSGISSRRLLRSAFTCDISGCVPGDQVRVPCLATGLDTAAYVYSHAIACARSIRLAGTIVGRPLTASFSVARDSEAIPSVEISTLALSGKGNNLVGTWLGGAAFDEAPRMAAEADSVRSLKASRRSVADRLLPNGQELLIGSPYGPMGDVYEIWKERFGHPDEDIVVVQASGPMLNPSWWTKARLEYTKRTDPFVYVTSGLGEFADPPDSLIPSEAIDCVMGDELERAPELDDSGRIVHEYVAALATAERGSGWSLVVLGTTGERDGQRVMTEMISRQWANVVGSPIVSRAVLAEVALLIEPFGLDYVFINNRFVNAHLEAANALNLGLCGVDVNGDDRIEICDKLRDAIVEKRLLLTSSRQQRSDLIHVQKVPTVNGIQVRYPSSGDGVACDFIEPLGLCVSYAPDAFRDDARADSFGPPRQRRRFGERPRATVL